MWSVAILKHNSYQLYHEVPECEPWGALEHFTYWNMETSSPEYSSLMQKHEKMLNKHHYAPHVILEVVINRIRIFVVLFVRILF